MSASLIDRNDDLRRLRDEGYSVFLVDDKFLVIDDIPYVDSNRTVTYGRLISPLIISGDETVCNSHVAHFTGREPCDTSGQRLKDIINSPRPTMHTATLKSDFMLSSRPPEGYNDYYEKMTTYVELISRYARIIDPEATPLLYRVMPERENSGVFVYPDTNSSRADVVVLSEKLSDYRIGIVGLGGTGSYILDMVSKTPVTEIRLIDGDEFLAHNAYRCPGAASVDELNARMKKVDYLKMKYSNMHTGITAYEQYLDRDSLQLLNGLNFVFIAVDQGSVKQDIFDYLDAVGIPYIDVGMELDRSGTGSLYGILRATLFDDDRASLRESISFGDPDDGLYGSNIQISELNALNAACAVILWKQRAGFYYTSTLVNEVVFLPHAFGVSTSSGAKEENNAA